MPPREEPCVLNNDFEDDERVDGSANTQKDFYKGNLFTKKTTKTRSSEPVPEVSNRGVGSDFGMLSEHKEKFTGFQNFFGQG